MKTVKDVRMWGVGRRSAQASLAVLFLGASLGTLAAQDVSLAPASSPASTAAAPDPTTVQQLKQQLQALSEKVQSLEDEQDSNEKISHDQAIKNAVTVSAGANGFNISSADHQFDLNLKGLLQEDDREFATPANNGASPGDGLFLRRARIIFDGTLWGAWFFRIEPEFGSRTGGAGGTSSTTATLANAYFNVNYWNPLQFQVGRFKGPLGYERSQLVVNNIWIENGLTQDLTPQYTQSVLAHGNIDSVFSYGAGISEGERDNANDDIQSSIDNNYNVVGDLFFDPFRKSSNRFLQGLGFGIAADAGNRGDVKTASNAPLATYTTPGQTSLLTYNTSSTATESEDGPSYRVTPVVYYYYGPFGGYADYAVSSVRALRTVTASTGIRAGSRTETFQNDAWQVVGSYLLTGENASYSGVKPREDFSFRNHTWGAFQLVARYGVLDLDDNYFRAAGRGAAGSVNGAFATQGPRKTQDIGFGVNWYLNENIKAQFQYDHDLFSGGIVAPTPENEDQNSFLTQLQLAF